MRKNLGCPGKKITELIYTFFISPGYQPIQKATFVLYIIPSFNEVNKRLHLLGAPFCIIKNRAKTAGIFLIYARFNQF